MSENTIPTLTEAMRKDMIDCVQGMFFAGIAKDFERMFEAVEKAPAGDFDALVRLISLAHAAHEIANAKEGQHGSEMYGHPDYWFREMGQSLLRRAMEALEIMAATEARGSGVVN